MQEIQLELSRPQINKLKKGGAVQLKASQMGCGMPLRVSDAVARRVARSMRSGKGMRLALSEEEIEGSGLFEDIKGGLKKASAFYKKNLKPVVGPLLKQGVKAGLKAAVAAASAAQPQLAPALVGLEKAVGNQAVDALGKVTGAYGLKKKESPEERKARLVAQLKRAREAKAAKSGGSFKAAGVAPKVSKGKKEPMVLDNYAKNVAVEHPSQSPVILDSPGGLPGSGGQVIHIHHHYGGKGFRPA